MMIRITLTVGNNYRCDIKWIPVIISDYLIYVNPEFLIKCKKYYKQLCIKSFYKNLFQKEKKRLIIKTRRNLDIGKGCLYGQFGFNSNRPDNILISN